MEALQDPVCFVLLVQREVFLDLAVFSLELLGQLECFTGELLGLLTDRVSFA